jgi:acetylglutamate kinase
VTDRKSLDVVTAVLAGLANKETVAAITRAGGRAVGISGVDGGMVRGAIRDRALGYIGEVTGVDPLLIRTLLAAGFMPVVSPVGYNESPAESEPLLLNINGDTAAGEIAATLRAKKLVYLTDVPGIRDARGQILKRLSQEEAHQLVSCGVATGGMIPKLKSCLVAAAAGVACHIVDGRKAGVLADTVANRITGTTIA